MIRDLSWIQLRSGLVTRCQIAYSRSAVAAREVTSIVCSSSSFVSKSKSALPTVKCFRHVQSRELVRTDLSLLLAYVSTRNDISTALLGEARDANLVRCGRYEASLYLR